MDWELVGAEKVGSMSKNLYSKVLISKILLWRSRYISVLSSFFEDKDFNVIIKKRRSSLSHQFFSSVWNLQKSQSRNHEQFLAEITSNLTKEKRVESGSNDYKIWATSIGAAMNKISSPKDNAKANHFMRSDGMKNPFPNRMNFRFKVYQWKYDDIFICTGGDIRFSTWTMAVLMVIEWKRYLEVRNLCSRLSLFLSVWLSLNAR